MKRQDKEAAIFAAAIFGAGLLTRYLYNKYPSFKEGYISEFYTIEDVEFSNTANAQGIDNKAPAEVLASAAEYARVILDPLTRYLGFRVKQPSNSWYRVGELTNYLYTGDMGGYQYSDHEKGSTADLDTPGNEFNHDIVEAMLILNLPFKQMILERGSLDTPQWVHVAYDPDNNKREILFYNGLNYSTIDVNDLLAAYGY